MLSIKTYSDKYQAAWDRFVLEESVNGTFLQTRNFLSYHPAGRFKDCSLLAMNDSTILAVIPACKIMENGKKCFISHMGSTYGGLIIGKSFYDTALVNDLLVLFDGCWRENEFERVVLKLTSGLLCSEATDLLEYMLQLHGFNTYSELSSYIDFRVYEDPIIMNLNKSKRQIIKQINPDYEFRAATSQEERTDFYELLLTNYKKFNALPVHSLSEIEDFTESRLKGSAKLYGVFLHGTLLAGSMVFEFCEHQAAHTQYLASDPDDRKSNAMPFLYYSLIKHYKELGYRYLSWGISTEEQGRKLNFSLIRNKESYGSKFSVNRTFYKNY